MFSNIQTVLSRKVKPRSFLLLSIFIIIASFIFLNSQVSKADANLELWYPFDGNALDASGNGNDGVVNGAILTADRFGVPNSAYLFDGVDDFIDAGTSDFSLTGQLTLSAWVNFDNSVNWYNVIIQRGSTISPFALQAEGGSGSVRSALRTNGSGNFYYGAGSLGNDVWRHLTLVYDGASATIYLDGSVVGSTARSGNLTVPVGEHTIIGQWPGNTTYPFKGAIDDVVIYSRALNATEVTALYESGVVPPVCTDSDSDGFSLEGAACGVIDCNDTDSHINPSATEICTDGLDNNCDGLIDDADTVACPTTPPDPDPGTGDAVYVGGFEADNLWSSISNECLDTIRSKSMFLGSRSFGANISYGLQHLQDIDPRYAVDVEWNYDLTPDNPLPLNVFDNGPKFVQYNYPLEPWPQGIQDFDFKVRNYFSDKIDVGFMNVWAPYSETWLNNLYSGYTSTMSNLRADFPSIDFVYFTHHIYPNESIDNVLVSAYNDRFRAEFQGNVPMYDIADILSTRPDGSVCSFTYNGQVYRQMCPEYNHTDGLHPNTDIILRRLGQGMQVLLSKVFCAPTPLPVCTDSDSDGFSLEGAACGVIDCNDTDSHINPSATEICTDGLDNNCDGLIDDADTVACPTTPPDPDPDPNLDANLELWYPFDGNALDASGNGNDGTPAQGSNSLPPTWEAGQINDAVRLYAGGNRVEVANDSALDFSGDYTISAWINGADLSNGSYQMIYIDINPAGGWNLEFGINASTRKLQSYINNSNSFLSSTPLDNNRWYHVALVWDGSNRTFYLDGVADGVSGGANLAANGPVSIGGQGLSVNYGFNGLIDDLRVYSRALTAAEISSLYGGTNPPPPLPVCTDSDSDGFSLEGAACGVIDCNDTDSHINPSATEICTDGLDNNCDGLIDDADTVACPTTPPDPDPGTGDIYPACALDQEITSACLCLQTPHSSGYCYSEIGWWPTALTVDPNQKLNLREEIPLGEARFPLTGKVWPSNYGEAHVSLWKDDKISSASFTIDDNDAPEIGWFINQGNNYDWKFTWFLIVDYLENPFSSYFGTWDDYRNVWSLGHDIGSHTLTHGHCGDGYSIDEVYLYCDRDVEYGLSQEIIQERISPDAGQTMAYSGTSQYEHDPNIASKYYISARGTTGLPNIATQTWYMNTRGTSLTPSIIDMTLDPNTVHFYRGWMNVMTHGASDLPISTLDYLKSKEDDIWVGLFRDIAKYAQERDTHSLTVNSASSDEIRFSLTDEMLDSLYNYPLTVKVRLDSTWADLSASQNGIPVDFTLLANNGENFVLVQAVPDQGEVVLTKI